MECHNGFIGYSTNTDPSDCFYRTYSPELPLWQTSFIDTGDRIQDYVSWTCNDSSELETVDENGNFTHPHGFEPTEAGQKGGDFSDDIKDEGDGWDTEGTTIVIN